MASCQSPTCAAKRIRALARQRSPIFPYAPVVHGRVRLSAAVQGRYRHRQFYLAYPKIVETVTPQSLLAPELRSSLIVLPLASAPIRESVTPESQMVGTLSPPLLSPHPELIFRLSYSHLAEIIQLPDETQRRFYEIECIRGNWSVRELKRQIVSLYYQRSGLSQDRKSVV